MSRSALLHISTSTGQGTISDRLTSLVTVDTPQPLGRRLPSKLGDDLSGYQIPLAFEIALVDQGYVDVPTSLDLARVPGR